MPQRRYGLSQLAGILTLRREPEQAVVVLEEALPILEQSRGPKHPTLHQPLLHLAQAYQRLGRFEDALAMIDRAEANARENHGTDHPDYAEVLHLRGRLLGQMGREQAALASLRRALEIRTEQLGAEHHRTQNTRSMLGQVELDFGHTAEARAWLEPLVPAESELSVTQAHAAFNLARCLPASDRSRALALAERARQTLAARDPDDPTLADIDAWRSRRDREASE